MKESNGRTTNRTSNIQCIEVLISKRFIVNNANLHWTLSVYSLENQPVRKSGVIQNSEIFHFMLFDWRRTVKKLLEESQVPYAVVDYFEPRTIYFDSREECFSGHVDERSDVSVLRKRREEELHQTLSSLSRKGSRQKTGHFLLDESNL